MAERASSEGEAGLSGEGTVILPTHFCEEMSLKSARA